MTEQLHFHFSLPCFGEGNGNPVQCSCLENPRDWGAWWAAVSGVAQSRTLLKWLSSFPGGSVVKNLPANAGDMGLNPGLERSHRGENGNPLQYSCLGNPVDRGAWWAIQSIGSQRIRHDWATFTFTLYISMLLLLLLSRFSRVRLCATPETAAHQAPQSLGFSRQEHWSGLPFPSPMHESEKWKWSCSVVSDS